MTLGDIVGRLANETYATEALLALGDLALVVDVGASAETWGETPGDYASGAARRFASLAGSEDWLSLMNAIQRAEDPGATAFALMLRWALDMDAAAAAPAAQGCKCGSGAGEGHVHP